MPSIPTPGDRPARFNRPRLGRSRFNQGRDAAESPGDIIPTLVAEVRYGSFERRFTLVEWSASPDTGQTPNGGS